MLDANDKEWIELMFKPFNIELKHITNHLSKINGKVQKHEDIITKGLTEKGAIIKEFQDFEKNMAHVPKRLKELEEYRIKDEQAHRLIIKVITLGGIGLGSIVAGIEIYFNLIQ